jgi:hypothetical protein
MNIIQSLQVIFGIFIFSLLFLIGLIFQGCVVVLPLILAIKISPIHFLWYFLSFFIWILFESILN